MENVKKINDELTVVPGQITPEQLQQAAEEGFKSVLNLRAPEEEDFVDEEPLQAEAAGLYYVNIPVKTETITDKLTDLVLQRIDELPKPALIHCKSGMRSGAMAMMKVAIDEALTPDQAFEKAQQMGFDCEANLQMKEHFKHYLENRAKSS